MLILLQFSYVLHTYSSDEGMANILCFTLLFYSIETYISYIDPEGCE